jgi:hypothetical protein
MEKDKLGSLGSFIGTLCFIVFGIVGYMNLSAPLSRGGIIFGIIISLIFGFITKFFMGNFLSLMNRGIAKDQGKRVVKSIVKRCTIYMFPYAVMVSLAAYFLGWSAAGVFFSAALMNVGVVAASEISRLKGKDAIRNNIATSIIAVAISFLWMISSNYLKNIPGLLDGVITMALGLMGVNK